MNTSEFKLNLAVVIGINDYRNGIPALGTARQDAEAIATILETEYHYQVHLITENQATAYNLRQWLDTELPEVIKKVTPSRLLFYFAGHGIALNGDDGPQGYLIPQDAKLGDVSTYIPMQQVEAALTQLSCRHCLVILDCCFAGAFRWSSTRKLIPITETIHKERYDRFIQDPAWQVITSAASDQSALDNLDLKGDRGIAKNNTQHSPFAAALIEALSGTADAYPPARNGKPAGDGVITATELYLYLRDAVEIPTDTNFQRQTPQIWCLKKHDKGEFIFLPPGHELNLPPAPSIDELEDNNPYRGLKSYEIKDSSLFFGRTTLIEKLCDAMSDRPFTVVLGASGSGKSSLVKAGLMAHLNGSAQTEQSQHQRLKPQKQPHLCKHPAWTILDPIRPGESPLSSLHIALKELGASETSQDDSKTIAVWSQANPGTKLLLVVDQLEELVTLCRNDRERQQFLDLLADLLEAHPDRLRLVITLRSDFEPQFRSTPLEPLWQAARFVVPAMTREELREAIEEPASVKVVYFESLDGRGHLVDQLIDEVAGMPGALPLLSFALSELYLRLARRYLEAQITDETIERAITWADYDELGGVTKSLTRRADEEYEALVQADPAYEQTIRHVMLRMVAVGGEMARRQVPESELRYPEPENTRILKVINQFSSARLLVSGTDVNNNPYIEPAHDALVRGWEKLLGWKKKEEENLILQRRLTPAAAEWDSFKNKERSKGILDKAEPVMNWLDRRLFTVENLANRIPAQLGRFLRRSQSQQELSQQNPSQFLWDGNPYLSLLDRELQSEDNWLNQVEGEFVQQSVLQKRRKSSWRWRIAIGVILGLSGLTIAALYQAEVSSLQAKAAKAQNLLTTDSPMEGLILAIQATGESQDRLRKVLPQIQTVLPNAIDIVRERNILGRHDGWVISVAVSHDDKYIATGSQDSTVRLLSIEGKLLNIFTGHQGWVNSVAFSPDGKHIVSGGQDSTLRSWSIESRLSKTFKAPNGSEIYSVVFSRDGKYIATGNKDSTVQLWSIEGKLLNTLKSKNKSTVRSVAFSPDGKYVISGNEDSTIQLWSIEGKLLNTFKRGHPSAVMSVTFSPDGRYIVSGGIDRTVRLWDINGQLLDKRNDHEDQVASVTFSRDSQYIVSSSFDNSLRLWRIINGSELVEQAILRGHKGEILSTAISDSRFIVSGGRDGTVRKWSIDGQPNKLLKITEDDPDKIMSVTFSPNGKYIASGNYNSTTRLWPLNSDPPIILKGNNEWISPVAFSSNSKYIIRGSDDCTIHIWSVDSYDALESQDLSTKGTDCALISVAFSPNSQYIVSGSADHNIYLWSVSIENNRVKSLRLNKLCGHRGPVNSVVFSPDGKFILSGSDDKTVRLWSIKGKLLKTMQEQDSDRVNSVAFSPNSRYIVSGSSDSTIRMWSLTGEPLNPQVNPLPPLRGHRGWIYSVAFSPDGKQIVSSGQDRTLQVWSFDGDNIGKRSVRQAILKGHFGEVYSAAFSPDGKQIVSGGDINELRLWPNNDWREWLQTACNNLRGHPILKEAKRGVELDAKNICSRFN
jgi:WD40 repeat protein/energy-coupling factor transporter ATP-binding protein EcfA2